MQGRSLAPLLEGHTPQDWRKTLYYQYFEFPGAHKVRRHYGVADGRYKLIHFYEPDVDEWELIDLRANPGENRNFYDDPAYRDVRRRLMGELKRLQKMHQVPPKDPDGKERAPMP
jgi:arylsulfatase A-like enzyme